MAFFTITKSDEFQGASVIFDDGSTQTIASDNGNYEAVVKGLLDGSLTDEELLHLIAPFEAIYKTLTRLSERVSRKGSKLLFDGDVVNNALSAFIIDLMNADDDESWKAYVAFMEKLYTNPSKRSQDHLFKFIEANGLQVTPDGDIVLYKGTKDDGKSTHAGYGIVDGVEFKHDYLQNDIGVVVEIPRSMVDENPDVHCSTGLHVGAFEYVTGHWSSTWPTMWVALVNPRDVVAVPTDFESSKIRVTRYTIAAKLGPTNKAVKNEGLVWTAQPAAPAPVEVVIAETKPEAVAPVEVAAKAAPAGNGSRVDEYKSIILGGGVKNLRRYRNKSVTPGRRAEFDTAVKDLGLQY